ncbi:MAG: OmpA family protein [Burkholderiaceae bacterium]|nr:OmpA family protein [Burkholderiaceae bacterium]
MNTRSSLSLFVLLGLAGCAQLSDRVILLPGPNGQAGAVEVQSLASGAKARLDRPYARADVRGGDIESGVTSPAAVDEAYGELSRAQPARPRAFVVRFQANSNQLTADSLPVLAEALALLPSLPAAELIVIGHTDRVGTLEANDKLSLVRAQAVSELLVKAGVARELISVVGRGEREPLIPTADEVAEPGNRRVDVKLR